MAEVKITDYFEIDALADADLIEVVDDVAGTPTSKKSTWTKVKSFLKTYFDTLYATLGVNADITSMTGLDDDGIPLAKVANAASDQANSSIVSINLTGGQVAFPATAVPSADPNTLDDYEEGTHTVVCTCSTSGGYVMAVGHDLLKYTKTGNTVTISANSTALWIASENSPNGVLRFSLPFTCGDGTAGGCSVLVNHGGNIPNSTFAEIPGAATFFRLINITDAGVKITIDHGDVDTEFELYGVGFSYLI